LLGFSLVLLHSVRDTCFTYMMRFLLSYFFDE
jgi:hypothetical protein